MSASVSSNRRCEPATPHGQDHPANFNLELVSPRLIELTSLSNCSFHSKAMQRGKIMDNSKVAENGTGGASEVQFSQLPHWGCSQFCWQSGWRRYQQVLPGKD